jgi:hypothetical protein
VVAGDGAGFAFATAAVGSIIFGYCTFSYSTTLPAPTYFETWVSFWEAAATLMLAAMFLPIFAFSGFLAFAAA